MANYNTDSVMLSQSIISILNQTYKDFEFIIVDDASTDSSFNVLLEFAQKDSRIKLYRNEINSGLAYSMNRAIDYSNGEYIARMDTDDIAIEDRFAIQVAFLDMNQNIDICGSFARNFGANNNFNLTPYYKSDYCAIQLLFATCLVHPTVMIRKEFLKKNNLTYNENFRCSQDFDLWTKAVEYGKIEMINKVLLFYRIHSNQISTSKRGLQRKYAVEICTRQIQKLINPITEEELKLHLVICGFEPINESNIGLVAAWIKKLLTLNLQKKLYNPPVMEEVLNNRIFNLILKSDMSKKKKLSILVKYGLINASNINTILYRLGFRIRYNRYYNNLLSKINVINR